MNFITDNQVLLVVCSVLAGAAGTALIWREGARSRAWKTADLVWLVLGVFGALVAVVAGIYKSDTFRIERQIDLAYALTREFDRDAARFRLQFCDVGAPADGPVHSLCDKVEYLSASTARNQALPLFLEVTQTVAPLQGLHLFARAEPVGGMSVTAMTHMADAFDPGTLVVFAAEDDGTRAAVQALRQQAGTAGVAGDFQVLAMTYEGLIEQVTTLKADWEYLRANARILTIQVIALCLVAFAAPFRLGKSIKELI